MSIRFKAVSIILFALIAFLISILSVNKSIMSDKIESYESAQVIKESDILKKSIYDDIKSLNLFTHHLSKQQLFQENSSKIDTKLFELTQLENIDFIIKTDANGETYSQYLSQQVLEEYQDIGLIFNMALSETPFVTHYTPELGDSFIAGLYPTTVGNALIAATSFADSSGKSHIIIAGQLINDFYLAKLEQVTSYKLSLLSPFSSPDKFKQVAQRIKNAQLTNLVNTSEHMVTVSSAFPDIQGNTVAIINLVIDREIKDNIQKILIQSIKYTAIFAILVSLLIIVFLHTQIIVPIKTISKQMIAFRQTQNLPSNPFISRGDEIGLLSREFINLVEDVGFFKRTLAETTYDASIIAITQNIFLYIGKNFSKNLESLNNIQNELNDFPKDKLISLQKQLTSKNISDDEKQKLTLQFIGYSLKISSLPTNIAHKIEEITSIMERVLVTTNKDLFSERPLLKNETIELEQILDHAYDSLPTVTRNNINFKCDLEIKSFGAPTLNRVTLQFVIQEAIENSAQAIHRSSKGEGLIKALSKAVKKDLAHYVVIEIHDNGIGLSKEAIDNIFNQKGIKKNSIGPGLSWCKSALNTLGGDIEVKKNTHPHHGSVVIIHIPSLK